MLGGKQVSGTREHVTVELNNDSGSFSTSMSAWVLPTITGPVDVVDWNQRKTEWQHLRDVDFPDVLGPCIDMLIGVNSPECHTSLEERHGTTSEPVARQTPLGWTCYGPLNASSACDTTMLVMNESESLDSIVKKFWASESAVQHAASETPSVDDCRAEDIVNRGKSFEDGRFVFNIPWNQPDERPHVRSNREQAARRLVSLERSLRQKPSVAEEYRRVMLAHEAKGYIRPVSDASAESDVDQWYLPHFPVVREDKTTTKVRVVYDAAARWDGTSLNDQMFSGPALQSNIVDVLLSFSLEPIALVGDISEMFLQVRLKEEDKQYHRLLWRAAPDEPVKTYEFNRVVFGVRASPYLAGKAIKETATMFGSDYSDATVKLVNNSFYVDDLTGSLPDVKAAISARQGVQEILARSGFHMRKWMSNSEAVVATIPPSDRASVSALNLGDHTHCTLPTVRTLGISWTAAEDAFTFRYGAKLPTVFTKRSVLSGFSTIFDPRGQNVPFTVHAKVLFQDAWLCNIGWDDPLPLSQQLCWKRWFNDLPELAEIRIPRSFKDSTLSAADAKLTVHTFTEQQMQS